MALLIAVTMPVQMSAAGMATTPQSSMSDMAVSSNEQEAKE
jgi:hypothetical protein